MRALTEIAIRDVAVDQREPRPGAVDEAPSGRFRAAGKVVLE
jgi:hypothetical protein